MEIADSMIYRSLNPLYLQGSNGIMIIYDICDAKSFDIITDVIDQIKEHAPRDVEIMLLGNKCDMEYNRTVNKDTGERFAAEHGMTFMEVSARAHINIQESFFTLARQIMAKGEDATGSDECTEEDGSDELRTGNACVVQ